MIIINVVEEIIKEKHIGYYTERDVMRETISLHEIFDAFYMNPQSDGHSLISRIESKKIVTRKLSELKAAPLLVLENAQNNTKLFAKKINI